MEDRSSLTAASNDGRAPLKRQIMPLLNNFFAPIKSELDTSELHESSFTSVANDEIQNRIAREGAEISNDGQERRQSGQLLKFTTNELFQYNTIV